MEQEREFLHQSDDLTIELVIDADVAEIVLRSEGPDAPDLSAADDLVVVFEGEGLPIDIRSARHVVASIDPERLHDGGTLMVRVHDFLDGWEF